MNDFWTKKLPHKLQKSQYSIVGYSVAAIRTGFYIPELKIMFDNGVVHNLLPDYIFLTHGHADHSFALPTSIIQLVNTMVQNSDRKMTIYCPHQIVARVKNYINSAFDLTLCGKKQALVYEIIGVAPSTKLDIMIRSKPWKLEIFYCDHTVPCVGYGLLEIRDKLKQEYMELEKKELGKLKKEGVEITNKIEHPLICYLGDTSISIMKNPEIYKYPTIMVECTFIMEDEQESAYKNKHIYWGDLENIIKLHPDNTFILYHFSSRYKPEEIHAFFKEKQYQNIVVWTDDIIVEDEK